MDINKIKNIILKADRKHAVKFIILFGSVAQGTHTPLSDIDIAVYYQGTSQERFDFRIKVALPDKVDLQVFQDLPLAVQKEVIAGKVVYYQNFQFIFDQFMRVIKDYGFFEKYYEEYLSSLRKGAEA